MKPTSTKIESPTTARVTQLFNEHQNDICERTDHMFAVLMTLQWVGGVISAFPIFLAVTRPGRSSTRYTIAVAQMLMGALLIHLTGGRIETHFHVFGSLAFLAFYRDWRVLVPATVVVALDHFLRGVFWPQSVYGVLSASSWRT